MRDLFERVVNDNILKELIIRARSFNMQFPLPNPVVVMEYKSSRHGTAILPRCVYSDIKEYERLFDDEQRSHYNGRTVIHESGSQVFEFLTDIVDNADEKKYGRWVIMGLGAQNPKTKQREFIMKEFKHYSDLAAEQRDLLNKIDEYALIHQYGRKDYTLVETGLILTPGDLLEELKNDEKGPT